MHSSESYEHTISSESDERQSADEEQQLLASHNQSQCKVTISLLCMSLYDNIT